MTEFAADHCASGHDCHPLASCVSGLFDYACRCPDGFSGDGREECSDADECNDDDGLGHHCHENSRCVNTVGSYECKNIVVAMSTCGLFVLGFMI